MRSSRGSDLATILVRGLILIGFFFVLAYGYALIIEARLGVAPWVTLHIGLTNHLPLTVGRATQLVGLAVILLALALGVRPRIGTWLNMILVGYFLDLVMAAGLLPPASGPARSWLYLFLGSVVMGLGVAGYLSAGFGAGPRDSLMLGLTRITGRPVGGVRTGLELAALGTGYLLGGPVGAGTVISALLGGPALQFWLALLGPVARTRLGGRLLSPPAARGFRPFAPPVPGGRPGG
ncbi:MAG: membrane protein [bacterium]|nr:membrane protein [bacterium]